MVKTGITRRIDGLGRLVIPKEIRKNLKIKENDQVEINIVDNKIILNKYDIVDIDNVSYMIINTLKKIINKNILLTSRDKILNFSVIDKNIKIINDEIWDIIEKRKKSINIIIDNSYYYIGPIVINGDLYGSLIVYSDNEINNQELGIIKYCQLFLENYLE